jgi:hypothetical protein
MLRVRIVLAAIELIILQMPVKCGNEDAFSHESELRHLAN